MISLSTKHTSKVPDYKRKQLERSLDKIVDKVSRRGIFVVSKNEQGLYDVINYLNQTPVLTGLPTRHHANQVCTRMNDSGYTWSRKRDIQRLLDQYAKLHLDCVFYIHTMCNTESDIKATVAENRLTASESRMKLILEDLHSLV